MLKKRIVLAIIIIVVSLLMWGMFCRYIGIDEIEGDKAFKEGKYNNLNIVADLDVDTNRDGIIDSDDEVGEDMWTKEGGAIFLNNNDKDEYASKTPDNWLGGDFDQDRFRDPEDCKINNAEDAKDITEFWIRDPGIPADIEIKLWLRVRTQDLAQHVRIFPKIEPSTECILCPSKKFAADVADKSIRIQREWSEKDITDLVLGKGDQKFGLEGLTYRTDPAGWDGTVELRYAISTARGEDIDEDVVKLKVAPFLIFSNLATADTVYVVPRSGNADFIAALNVALPRNLSPATTPPVAYQDSCWARDEITIGYSSVPRTATTQKVLPVVLNMPKDEASERNIHKWAREDLLGTVPDANPYGQTKMGYVEPIFPDATWPHGHTLVYGGNLELIPPTANYPFGRIIMGHCATVPIHDLIEHFDELTGFFDAQEVQGPVLLVDTGWLWVRHIDEVIAVIPSNQEESPGSSAKFKVVIASPSLALKILERLYNEAGHPYDELKINAGKGGGWEYTVKEIWSDDKDQIKTINNWIANNPQKDIRDTLVNEFGLCYDSPHPAGSPGYDVTKNDIIEVPVLFLGMWDASAGEVKHRTAMPLTQNVANMLVVVEGEEKRAIVGEPNGPKIPGQAHDEFKKDIEAKLTHPSIGLTVKFVDSWYYHVHDGDVRCATNVRHKANDTSLWWEKK
jgi:protein-arginine deiminase